MLHFARSEKDYFHLATKKKRIRKITSEGECKLKRKFYSSLDVKSGLWIMLCRPYFNIQIGQWIMFWPATYPPKIDFFLLCSKWNQAAIMNIVFTQPKFFKSSDQIQKERNLEVSHAHTCMHKWERERERERRNLKNVICPSLPQYYHDHSGQWRCTCRPWCHLASFGFSQHRHHGKLHDLPFPVNKPGADTKMYRISANLNFKYWKVIDVILSWLMILWDCVLCLNYFSYWRALWSLF